MKETDILLERFRKSIEDMPNEDFLKLLDEIEAQPQQENELTVGEFLSLISEDSAATKPLFADDLEEAVN